MADNLTPQQRQAVEDRGGKLLVSAAAGSGKTKVLVDRLLSYITNLDAPANIDDFLIITFTKAAAAELRGKIAEKLTERISADPNNRHLQQQLQRMYLAKISTVHSFCTDLLREQAYQLELSADFRVAEDNECAQIQQEVLDQMLEETYENLEQDVNLQVLMDTQGFGRTDKRIPEIILQLYTSARCHLNPDGWLEWCKDAAEKATKQDPGSTPWGAWIIENLHRWLALHIDAMENCVNHVLGMDCSGSVAETLEGEIRQLKHLTTLNTWQDIHECRELTFKRLTFPKKFPDPELKEQIQAVRNACKEEIRELLKPFQMDADKMRQDLSELAGPTTALIQLVQAFSRAYDRQKKRFRILDYGDLEHKALDLLMGKSRSGPTAFAKEVGRRFREVMVDEYQDTNEVQDSIFLALTTERQNCFMVGDVKQSIYRFRLADPGIFIEKYKSYAAAGQAEPGQGRKVMLSRNFRSAGAVIEAVNHVFTGCMTPEVGGLFYGADEMLYEGIPHKELGEPEVELWAVDAREDSGEEEAVWVAFRIQKLLEEKQLIRDGEQFRPVRPEDIVILLRAPSSTGGDFQYALDQLGIPWSSDDGGTLLEEPEVEELISILQTIVNPSLDIPLVGALSGPVFGFTADELAQIRSQDRNSSFFRVLQADEGPRVRQFLELLEELRREARMNEVSRLLQTVFAKTKIDSIYAAMEDGASRIAHLQEFCQLAAAWEGSGHRDLGQFLAYLESLRENEKAVGSGNNLQNAVRIMSIHKSKGLEFPVVFLCGLSHRINQMDSYDQVLCHRDLGLGLACIDPEKRIRYSSLAKRAIAAKLKEETISEELRVLYVAMTRARDRLIMSYSSVFLKSNLENLTRRMKLSDHRLLTGTASCPGTWILLSALRRTDAGALFEIGGNSGCSSVPQRPWRIQVTEAPEIQAADGQKEDHFQSINPDILERMEQYLSFQYPYSQAIQIPSKITATQLKGRMKDQEAAESAKPTGRLHRQWPVPSFAEKTASATDRGNAVHHLMQRIRYQAAETVEGVRMELDRLCLEGHMTREEANLVDSEKVARFFGTDLGKKLAMSTETLREFKFSILVPASEDSDEQVLLQGVVDCAIMEPDGMIILDFKTDRLRQEQVQDGARKHTAQVLAYAEAMKRIYKTRVKEAYLYFFHCDEFYKVL